MKGQRKMRTFKLIAIAMLATPLLLTLTACRGGGGGTVATGPTVGRADDYPTYSNVELYASNFPPSFPWGYGARIDFRDFDRWMISAVNADTQETVFSSTFDGTSSTFAKDALLVSNWKLSGDSYAELPSPLDISEELVETAWWEGRLLGVRYKVDTDGEVMTGYPNNPSVYYSALVILEYDFEDATLKFTVSDEDPNFSRDYTMQVNSSSGSQRGNFSQREGFASGGPAYALEGRFYGPNQMVAGGTYREFVPNVETPEGADGSYMDATFGARR